MKSYTDLEQSKKLSEFLPIESADFFWLIGRLHTDGPRYQVIRTRNEVSEPETCWPCWSLAALLQVLPLGIYDESDNCDYELEIDMIDKMPRYIRLGDIYHSQFPYDFEKDTLLDNIVESIIWLNDNNYFEL